MDRENIRSGTVTRIDTQARDPERFNVFIEGEFAFSVDQLVAAEHDLHVGRQLTSAEIEGLLAADEASRATAASLQFLGYRPRSRAEVERRLARRGFSEAAVAVAIERLERWHYLDDDAFARAWIESRAEHQPRGRRLIQQELREKGVAREVVEQALEEIELDEYPAALELARKRARSLRGEAPLVRRRRLAGYLQRRGYGWDVVSRVLDALLGDEDDADEGTE
jgi:regulatory protein